MAKKSFVNRGTARGKIAKIEIVKYGGGDTGKKEGELLSVSVNTGKGNRVDGTMFASKANPDKLKEITEQFKVGSEVEIVGGITEQVRESKGREFIDRKLSIRFVNEKREDAKESAYFIYQGIIEKLQIKEASVTIVLRYEETFERADGTKGERIERVTFTTSNESVIEEIQDLDDLEKGGMCKIKGKMLNKVITDDYDDIIDRVQMYEIEKVENVISKDELEEDEEEADFM